MENKNYTNDVLFGTDATDQLLEGAERVYKAVSSTLGPKSRLVAIQHPYGNPTTVGDGVTVAKAVVQYGFDESGIDTGAKLLAMGAVSTNDIVGDGTTTTTILAYEVAKEANKAIKNGSNAMILRKGMLKAVDDVCDYLDTIKTPVTEKQIKQVATISAQDEKLGEMIADGFERLGKNGVITVEEATGSETSIEFKEGMEFNTGYLSNYFVTSPETNEATVTSPYILVTDYKLDKVQGLLEFLNNFIQAVPADGRNLVIVCDGAEPICLATLVKNKIQGIANILAIQAPGNLDHKTDLLKDIAVATGATFISKETKTNISEVTIEQLGRADHVTSSASSTVIVDGKAIEEDMRIRIEQLTDRKDHPDTSAFDREKLTERLAKLTSGIGIISVGGSNEAERSEMRERAIDAVEATKAALEDGVVAGGETALLRATRKLMGNATGDSDESVGYMIVMKACVEPFAKLMDNSHLDIKFQPKDDMTGVDVISGELTNLIDAGILDPVKIPKTALEMGVKTAIQILATDTVIGVKATSINKD